TSKPVITPRTTRLVRVPDLQALQAYICRCVDPALPERGSKAPASAARRDSEGEAHKPAGASEHGERAAQAERGSRAPASAARRDSEGEAHKPAGASEHGERG